MARAADPGNAPALVVRPASTDDAASIIAVINPIIDAGMFTVMPRPLSKAEQIDFIRSLPERAVYHVAVEQAGGRVLGCQDVLPFSTEPAHQHVGAISTFVALDARRRGVGAALMCAMIDAAREQGYRKITAVIRTDNPDALAFYQRQDFEAVGTARAHAMVDGRYIDEVIAERWIGTAPA